MTTAPTNIFCPSCGRSLPVGAAYCRYCGKPVPSSAERQPSMPQEARASNPVDREPIGARISRLAEEASGGPSPQSGAQSVSTRVPSGQDRTRRIEVVVEPLLLWIGSNDVFHLPNISRVSVQREVRKAPVRTWLILAIIALSAIASVGKEGALDTPLIITFLGTGGYLIYSVFRYATTPPLNLLIIEAGTAYPILASREEHTVTQLKDRIADSLRNPPKSRQIYNFQGDFISGNTINQAGGGTMSIGSTTRVG